jgi:hypothetical protein
MYKSQFNTWYDHSRDGCFFQGIQLTADDAEDHGDDDDQDEERQRNDQHELHPVSLRNPIEVHISRLANSRVLISSI